MLTETASATTLAHDIGIDGEAEANGTMMPTRRDILALLLFLAGASAVGAEDGGDDGSGGSDSDGDSGHGGGGDDGGDDGGGDDGGDDGEDGNENGGGHHGKDGARHFDHDDARDARRRGEIIPLSEALEIVAQARRGRVIDVSLTKDLFGAIYTFKLKARSGRVTSLRLNARTGKVIGGLGF